MFGCSKNMGAEDAPVKARRRVSQKPLVSRGSEFIDLK
jgi:hypothetical protein